MQLAARFNSEVANHGEIAQSARAPASPCKLPRRAVPYDLVVDDNGVLYRIQVKTTNGKDRTGAWRCHLAQNPKYRKTVVYDPDDVDFSSSSMAT